MSRTLIYRLLWISVLFTILPSTINSHLNFREKLITVMIAVFFCGLFISIDKLIREYKSKGPLLMEKWRWILFYLVIYPAFMPPFVPPHDKVKMAAAQNAYEVSSVFGGWIARIIVFYAFSLVFIYGIAWLVKVLTKKKLSPNVFGIVILLLWLPANIGMGISVNKVHRADETNLNQLSVCLKKNIQTIHEASFTDVDFSLINEDFYGLPEVVLFTDGDIQSLTDLHAIRRSFKAHLKKYEQQDALMQKSLQPTTANELSFLRILVPICEKCEPWSRMTKQQQEGIIIGFKQGRLNNIEKMKFFLHEHHMSSGIAFKIAYLKESLKLLDVWQDVLLDNANEPSIKLKQDFDLHVKNINEIVKKESEFRSDVEK